MKFILNKVLEIYFLQKKLSNENVSFYILFITFITFE